MRNKLLWGIALILVAALLGSRVYSQRRNRPVPEPQQSAAKPVEVLEAIQGEVRRELVLTGTIQPQKQVTVYPKLTGVIQQMHVELGSSVHKGQQLAVIEHEELSLELAQAEAVLASAQQVHRQAVRLAETRVRNQAAHAQAALDSAKAALSQIESLAKVQAETQVERADAALASLQANLSKLRRGGRAEEREQVRSTVAQAEASLAQVQNDHARVKALLERRAVSRQTFETSQTALKLASEQLNAARQQWVLLEKGAQEEDLVSMQARIRQAEAELGLARLQVEEQLWKQDVVMSQALVTQAEVALSATTALVQAKSWETEIAASHAAMVQSKAACELARKRIADASIVAPISGTIAMCALEESGLATPSQALFEIIATDVVHAEVSVLEPDLVDLQLGAMGDIRTDVLDEPLPGTVAHISPVVEPMSRTIAVKMQVDNPGHQLKCGMFVRVHLPVEIRQEATLVPRAALLEEGATQQKYVFVVDGGRAVKQPVTQGMRQGNLVEIPVGLSVGARVVIFGQQTLRDGDAIEIVRSLS